MAAAGRRAGGGGAAQRRACSHNTSEPGSAACRMPNTSRTTSSAIMNSVRMFWLMLVVSVASVSRHCSAPARRSMWSERRKRTSEPSRSRITGSTCWIPQNTSSVSEPGSANDFMPRPLSIALSISRAWAACSSSSECSATRQRSRISRKSGFVPPRMSSSDIATTRWKSHSRFTLSSSSSRQNSSGSGAYAPAGAALSKSRSYNAITFSRIHLRFPSSHSSRCASAVAMLPCALTQLPVRWVMRASLRHNVGCSDRNLLTAAAIVTIQYSDSEHSRARCG